MFITRDQPAPIPTTGHHIAPEVPIVIVALIIGAAIIIAYLRSLVRKDRLLLWQPFTTEVIIRDPHPSSNRPGIPATLILGFPYGILVWYNYETFWHRLAVHWLRCCSVSRVPKSPPQNNIDPHSTDIELSNIYPDSTQTHAASSPTTCTTNPYPEPFDKEGTAGSDRCRWSEYSADPQPPNTSMVPRHLAKALTHLSRIKQLFRPGTTSVPPALLIPNS
ncbi:hypothetical protein FRC09_001110 [Ceratobasidium sp. 395]|nr:hypothetical protein FRC09_001110 [Ceratobasidium sp. 395]